MERERLEGSHRFDDDEWSLYRLADDFAEVNDLAAAEPDRLARMIELWWAEAGRNQVLPMDDTFIGRAIAMDPNPWPVPARMTYRVEGSPVAEDLLPPLGAGFDLTAEVGVDAGTEGIVAALGDWNNGFALFISEGRLVGAFSLFGSLTRLATDRPLAVGKRRAGLHYRRDMSGEGAERSVSLTVDGAAVAAVALDEDLPFRWQIGGTGLAVGRDRGLPVCDDYTPPFTFTGDLRAVEVTSHARRARHDADRAGHSPLPAPRVSAPLQEAAASEAPAACRRRARSAPRCRSWPCTCCSECRGLRRFRRRPSC